MTHAVTWHPDAGSEFDADIDWYEEREVGLGDQFEAQVLDAVSDSAATPDAWPVWPGWDRQPVVRSKGVADFPYRVVYLLQGDS